MQNPVVAQVPVVLLGEDEFCATKAIAAVLRSLLSDLSSQEKDNASVIVTEATSIKIRVNFPKFKDFPLNIKNVTTLNATT
ncbi:hypothetical protein CH359_13695 [Leptospira meyeri]|nr:hypothetical protein CH359_13695 [Leptospira meyeri]PJZ95527.1 hypothetical protein CH358_16935 [Leptospira meyeri]